MDDFLEMAYEDLSVADIDTDDEYICNWCGNFSDDCGC